MEAAKHQEAGAATAPPTDWNRGGGWDSLQPAGARGPSSIRTRLVRDVCGPSWVALSRLSTTSRVGRGEGWGRPPRPPPGLWARACLPELLVRD